MVFSSVAFLRKFPIEPFRAAICRRREANLNKAQCWSPAAAEMLEINSLFIVTNNGSGHSSPGLKYKEYQLKDYSSWFLKQLNNTRNWEHLKSCLVKSEDCNNLHKKYRSLKEYKLAKLTPIEAGCCRPPSECGYPAINASYYDLSFHPVSSNKDCKLYKNSRVIKCYNCDSCKAKSTSWGSVGRSATVAALEDGETNIQVPSPQYLMK
ncbi:Tetraspanin-10 [Asimina triloba]